MKIENELYSSSKDNYNKDSYILRNFRKRITA